MRNNLYGFRADLFHPERISAGKRKQLADIYGDRHRLHSGQHNRRLQSIIKNCIKIKENV